MIDILKKENESEYSYLWRLCSAKELGTINCKWDEIAEAMNKNYRDDETEYRTESSYRKLYQQAKKFVDAGVLSATVKPVEECTKPIKYKEETTIEKNGSYTSNKLLEMSEEQSKDPTYLLKAHGFNTDVWELTSARNSMWNVGKDGRTLYSSKISVRPIDEKHIPLSMFKKFFDDLDRHYSIPKLTYNNNYKSGNKMLLIDIADLHLNLQASMFTTDNKYNCEIAEKLFFKVINDIINRTKDFKFEKIIFTVGGDLLNSDNLNHTTTHGTPQDDDIHFFDAFEKACSLVIRAIDIMRGIAPVDVIYVPGNHDEVVGQATAKYISAWFRNDKFVNVDYKPRARKYTVYGKTLLCFTHNAKPKELPAIIANEAREWWHKVNNCEVFLQHLHSEQILMEDNNIRIQRLPTISARSKWSYDNGFSSKRQAKFFVFDKELGLQEVYYTPIPKE